MDYGKFKYQEQKRAHEAKLKQKVIQVKEIKLRPGTDEGDYQVKLRNLLRFLEEGDKVKITLRFRGRELAHQEFGMRQLDRIRTDVEAHALVEAMPKMEGRQMIMVLAPKRKGSDKSAAKSADKASKAAGSKESPAKALEVKTEHGVKTEQAASA